MGQLEGTVALVTETAVGIGRAIAEPYGREGATLVVNYSKCRTKPEATANLVPQAGGGGRAAPGGCRPGPWGPDDGRPDPEHCGRIDLLVNNAGIPVWRPAATS
jgi:3-oxoacyl-[acyl-carrier protein] reductase